MILEKLDVNSLIEKVQHSNVQHVTMTMQNQYIRIVVLLVAFNLVCSKKLRNKRQRKLWKTLDSQKQARNNSSDICLGWLNVSYLKKCLMLKERWEQKHLLDHTMVT